MAGSLNLFDAVDLTSASEYDSRLGEKVTTLQIHHSTGTSYAGTRALMDPGGRTVSSNGLMANDGTLYEVVPLSQRSFTSATGFDRRCLTVECNNITLNPTWGIAEACKDRFARLAVNMLRLDLLKGLFYGEGGLIGHADVPGTYATACPGPDMHVPDIIERAKRLLAAPASTGITPIPAPKRLEIDMLAFTCPELLKGWDFVIGLGYIKNTPGEQGKHYAAATAAPLHSWTAEQVLFELWNHGLGEAVKGVSAAEVQAFLHSLGNGGVYVASWMRSTPATVTNVTSALTAEDRAKIVADLAGALANVKVTAALPKLVAETTIMAAPSDQ